MNHQNIDEIWRIPNNKLIDLIENRNFSNLPRKIIFYAPSFLNYRSKYFISHNDAFPSISITGSLCALNCDHCNKKVLETMISATSPEELYKICLRLKKNGAIGCLISGGCSPKGVVPLDDFIDIIAKIKKELGLVIVVHTGLVDLSIGKRLKKAGIDAALIDIIGSEETIQKVYHLDICLEEYEKSLQVFHDLDIPFIPHVLVGLDYGELKGELEALKMIEKYSPSAVIVIAFMPIRGTKMEKTIPPLPEDIVRVLLIARLLMPNTPIALGCMRPKGQERKRIDILSVKAGVNAIAFPVEEAIQEAKRLNLDISFSPVCCSQIYNDIILNH